MFIETKRCIIILRFKIYSSLFSVCVRTTRMFFLSLNYYNRFECKNKRQENQQNGKRTASNIVCFSLLFFQRFRRVKKHLRSCYSINANTKAPNEEDIKNVKEYYVNTIFYYHFLCSIKGEYIDHQFGCIEATGANTI